MEKRVADGTWEYTPVAAELEAAGLYPIHGYIWIKKATIAAQVACWTIYELCNKAERRPRMSRMMIWWDQDVVQESEE